MQRDVIIACDFKSAEDTFRFLDLSKTRSANLLKIGMELFYAEGPLDRARDQNAGGQNLPRPEAPMTFPNTVKRRWPCCRGWTWTCNVHAAGTIEMMKAALEGLPCADGTRPLLIAVTQLTSTERGAHAQRTADRRLDQRHDHREIRARTPVMPG